MSAHLDVTRILAIETSCDETAAAVIEDGHIIRSNVIASQIKLHQQYGGVFPEMASRAHVEAIGSVIRQAMRDANADWRTINAVAVTRGPGLPGSLVVGVNAAKGICLARGLPLIGVNHLEGHIYSHWLDQPSLTQPHFDFPLIVLIVSGGHTELVLMRDHGVYELLGHTVDDAVGEAFDKVARMLGLDYPGGPVIERIAREGNAARFPFSKPRIHGTRGGANAEAGRGIRTDRYNGEFDFSFSGTKTAAMQLIQAHGGFAADDKPAPSVPVADVAASFQSAAVDWLVEKTKLAAARFDAKAVLVGGGVSANALLRLRMRTAFAPHSAQLPLVEGGAKTSIPISFPPLALCTDNAAMIGAAAHFAFARHVTHDLDMDVEPDLLLAI